MAKITLIPNETSRRFDNIAKNKDKIAWGYFGILEEYIIILSLMKEMVKNVDIEVFTNDNNWYKGNNKDNFFKLEEGIEIIEFKSEVDCNPMVNYFKGFGKKITPKIGNKNGLIITKTKIPNKSLTQAQIDKFINISKRHGFVPNIVDNADKETIDRYSFVGGAEGPEVWYGLKSNKVVALSKESLGASLLDDLGGIVV